MYYAFQNTPLKIGDSLYVCSPSSQVFALDPATGGITVPEKNLHDARLKLAGSGLTDSGKLGFELMERDPGFGVSQFVENARYQHALETELVRTITTLRPVRDARVHLAIPKPSAFTRQRDAASASVVLELRGGQQLERNQVDAIVHLVSSSIPDLAPERVTVVDQSGRMLTISDPNSEAALNAAQFERVRKLETSFNDRIRELLEPLTGPGRVNAEVAVDVRILSATHKNQAALVDEGRFRHDLYYRINVIELTLPSLRERREDIAELTQHFCDEFAGGYGQTRTKLPEELTNALYFYDWPGNVRELRNVVEHLFVMRGEAPDFNLSHLPRRIQPQRGARPGAAPSARPAAVRRDEAARLVELLERHGWDVEGKKRTAQALDIGIATLYRRLAKHGLNKR